MSGKREILAKNGLRLDGRRAEELRRIRCKLGIFTEPDGSAYIEQGLTKVLAAVYGPHQAKGSRKKSTHNQAFVNCQFSMAVFSTTERRKKPRGDRKATEMTMHLQQVMKSIIKTELFPYSQIDIYVEVLHADGGIFPVCVNVATLALVDAGIPIKEYVCACTASLANKDKAVLDISHEEEMFGPSLTVAALPISGKIIFMEMTKRFHTDNLEKVMNLALEGCKNIRDILDASVRMHLSDLGNSTGWGKR